MHPSRGGKQSLRLQIVSEDVLHCILFLQHIKDKMWSQSEGAMIQIRLSHPRS